MDERICFPYADDLDDQPDFINDIVRIYDKMQDDVSREIFVSRLMLSLTRDYKYMKNVILQTEGGKKLNSLLCHAEKPPYIYGAGIRGKRLVKLFSDFNWGGFIDISTEQESYQNIKIIDPEMFMNLYTKGTVIIVSNMKGSEKIVDNLVSMGVVADDIYVLNDFDQEGARNIYFEQECVEPVINGEKIFIDVGCYDGKDSINYMERTRNENARIYAFEPDIRNYKVCKDNLAQYPNITLFNVGLSDVEQELGVMGEGEMSYLCEDSSLKVKTQLLDNILQNQPVTFIKMDVEGYEMKVLEGAKKMIREYCPLLAVSIYHKKSDIWKIPQLILKIQDKYSFYMRYYGAASGDVVLYAVEKK